MDKVLALGNIKLRVPDPVAQCALVHNTQTGNMVVGIFLGDTPAPFSDNQHNLPFIIQLVGFWRAQEGLLVPGQGIGRAHKQTGEFRLRGTILVLRIAVGVVHADTGDFFGCAYRWEVADTLGGKVGSQAGSQSFHLPKPPLLQYCV